MRGTKRATVAIVAALALAACTSDGSGAGSDPAGRPISEGGMVPDPVELTQGDGCGEAFFWAATADGSTAVIASVRANVRSEDEPTTIPVRIPDELVTVEVLRGEDLPQNMCTDLIRTESEPTTRTAAEAGTGEIVLAPRHQRGEFGCGTSDEDPNGTLHLTGVTADDGTEFAPIEVETDHIGCYAG